MKIPEATIEDFFAEREVRVYLAKKLAPFYNKHSYSIAVLCDEVLDKSGNMLGWIREINLAAHEERLKEKYK